MKRKTNFRMILVTIFAVVAFSLPMMAQGECQVKGGQCCDHIPNLTADQKAKIQKLHLEGQKKMISLNAELEKQELDLKALLMEQESGKQVDAKVDEIFKIKARILKECLANCNAVRNLLTDEQKKHFGLRICIGKDCGHGSKHCRHACCASRGCCGKSRGQGGHGAQCGRKKESCHPAKAGKCSAPTS
jgi:Spy/CpxP family protein refolding chaperone